VTLKSDLRRISVVLCDDVAAMRSILHDVLAEDSSISIVGEAENGRDCVQLLSRLEPDIVLLDLSMPDMGGLEAIPLIVKNSPRTGIIVFSGFGGKRMGDAAIGLGADRYVEKGAALHELAAAVVEVAASRHERD
jgi:two-component system nitrate/nitrite response regulator NarL